MLLLIGLAENMKVPVVRLSPLRTIDASRINEATGSPQVLRLVGFFRSTTLQSDSWLRPLSHLPDFKSVLDLVLRREAEARAAFEAAAGHAVLT
jgi:hypothetical protein